MTCCVVWGTLLSLTAWDDHDQCGEMQALERVLGAVLALSFAGCGAMGPEPEARASTAAKPVPVTIAALDAGPSSEPWT